jgi:hypothetical protein
MLNHTMDAPLKYIVVLFLRQSHYVTQAGLELMVLLPQLPKC